MRRLIESERGVTAFSRSGCALLPEPETPDWMAGGPAQLRDDRLVARGLDACLTEAFVNRHR